MAAQASSGFSDAEKQAMRERAAELKASGRGGSRKAKDLEALLATIEQMPDDDRLLAERIHAIVTRVAPDLDAKTWYGQPAYARGKDVLVFFQSAAKYETRYATLGFNDAAELDDGNMWATSYALVGWSDAEEQTIEALVRRAAG